jgi:hypothetical protein
LSFASFYHWHASHCFNLEAAVHHRPKIGSMQKERKRRERREVGREGGEGGTEGERERRKQTQGQTNKIPARKKLLRCPNVAAVHT